MALDNKKTNYMNDGFTIKNINGEEEIILIPYNEKNILITEKNVISILEKYNIKVDKINRLDYFIEAFTHKSYCKKEIYPQNILDAAKLEINNPNLLELRKNSYERLEFLGDRVLKLVISKYLYERYPNQDEGFMTRLQTKIEDKKNFAIMSKDMELNKYFIISKHNELMNGRHLDTTHEDIFEAFMAALFESNGFEMCLLLITNLLETLIDYSEKLYCDNNYKDQLLRLHHQRKWKDPLYQQIYFEGPPHKRKYIMGVLKNTFLSTDNLKDRCISYGIGYSKKDGEQQAAKMALIIHGLLNSDQYSQDDIYYPPWDKITQGDIDIIKDPINLKNNNEII
jgi:ribonuclease-3